MSGSVWMFSDQIDDEDMDFMRHLVYHGLTANNTRCHVFRHAPSKKGCDQNCTQLSWTLLELVGGFFKKSPGIVDVVGACWTKTGLFLATSPR